MNGQALDLVILVPCSNMETSVSQLLARTDALGIRHIQYAVIRHPARDPGCRTKGHEFLRDVAGNSSYAMIMFDRAGCGQEDLPREEIERLVEEGMSRSGWPDRSAAIVLAPELEAWVWSDSPHVATCLGWKEGQAHLLQWLHDGGLWLRNETKPADPKSTMQRWFPAPQNP